METVGVLFLSNKARKMNKETTVLYNFKINNHSINDNEPKNYMKP